MLAAAFAEADPPGAESPSIDPCLGVQSGENTSFNFCGPYFSKAEIDGEPVTTWLPFLWPNLFGVNTVAEEIHPVTPA